MRQQGQVFELKTRGPDGEHPWAYRYRQGGRDSKRVQRGGFASKDDARQALNRALDSACRINQGALVTLSELVDEYLAQHDAQPETITKLRWLLEKSVVAFGHRPIGELDPRQIAAWRMALPPGHRFEATQALRQVLSRAVTWQLIDANPAKRGVDNPLPPRREMRPFESRGQLHAMASALGPRYGPMILFAAATGLRPGEWIALEWRDIDRAGRLIHVRRSFTNGRVKTTKTDTARAVPLQRAALDALDQLTPPRSGNSIVFRAAEGGHLDLHNWRPRHWRPAHHAAGITPIRRVYDLRHTFATFALRAGLGTFELSRYMGTSLVNIDRTYGHLTRDGHQHAIDVLDAYAVTVDARGRFVDVGTLTPRDGQTAETAR